MRSVTCRRLWLSKCQLLPSVLWSSSSIWGEHLSCFSYDAIIAKGMWKGTKTWAAVLLMGHLDVWAYVIQSQRAASNHTPIAGILLHGNRFAASLFYPGSHGSGNRSRQGLEACLSLSTSPSLSTHRQTHTCTHPHKGTYTVLSHCPCCSWSDLDLPQENQVALCSCSIWTEKEAINYERRERR